jgi:hypothetical protein
MKINVVKMQQGEGVVYAPYRTRLKGEIIWNDSFINCPNIPKVFMKKYATSSIKPEYYEKIEIK